MAGRSPDAVADAPALSSNLGAAQTLYLDFDGSQPFDWGGYQVGGSGSAPGFGTPVPAFSLDADVNNFSADELSAITHIFFWVAEQFSPFTINVTTVDPQVFHSSQNMTVLIGGSDSD